ncbi:GH25 family lysozyme [Pygmaiobacter massiliensis]|uniref:GH25 family lysozyme n=1 Tax=Pygmaiobacter massiliensis TaxID=1917873 RepID=UPI002A83E510|nr:GH25 family lysozyme [Pygmaiobacter massiliensis]MDY4784942.1 GH25 family lysozyme [Pygmaiobacter massiliensis]
MSKRLISFVLALSLLFSTAAPAMAQALPVASTVVNSEAVVPDSSSSEPSVSETTPPASSDSTGSSSTLPEEDGSSSSQPVVPDSSSDAAANSDKLPDASSSQPADADANSEPPQKVGGGDGPQQTMEEAIAAAQAAGTVGTDVREAVERTPFRANSQIGGGDANFAGTFPTTAMKNVVIFLRFADQAEYLSAGTAGQVELVYNSMGNTPTSLKDYIQKVSYGALTVDSGFFPSAMATVQVAHNEGYYRPYNATANPEGYQTQNDAAVREMQLLKEVMDQVGSQISNIYGSDADVHGAANGGADGFLDAVTFVCLPTNTANISWNDLLWPHQWQYNSNIGGGTTGAGNLGLRAFNLIWATSILSPANYSSSVISHEFLHVMGMPDLYRYSYNGNPVYNYDIMASTTSRQQQALLQYNIRNYLGFGSNLTQITRTTNNVSLSVAQYQTDAEQTAVIVKSPTKNDEYFVIEMRRSAGIDTNLNDCDGLLVYRINENIASGNRNGPQDAIFVLRPGETALNAGAGQYNLADLQLGAGHRNSLGKTGAVASFDNDTLYYSDGSNSDIVISNLRPSADGNSMTFDVSVPSDGVLDGWVQQDGETYYYQNGAVLTGVQYIDGKIYYFDTQGRQQYYFQNVTVDGVLGYRYFSTHGGAMMAGRWITPEEGPYTGHTYYLGSNGVRYEGVREIDGKTYSFDNEGRQQFYFQNVTIDGKEGHRYFSARGGAMLVNCWIAPEEGPYRGNTYYLGENGIRYQGPQKISGKTYCFDSEGRQQYYFQNVIIDGVPGYRYFSTYGGAMITNRWITPAEGPYKDATYYLGANGVRYENIREIDGKIYCFDNEGRQQYYFQNVTIQDVTGYRYFSSRGGAMLSNRWITPEEGPYKGNTYYLGENGVRYQGPSKINENIYCFDNEGCQQYYFQNVTIEGVTGYRYFSSRGGAMLSNRWITPEEGPYKGNTYYLGINGVRYENGRFDINNELHQFNAQGIYEYQVKFNDFSQDAYGNRIYCDQNGNRVTGVQKIKGNVYYFDTQGRQQYYFQNVTVDGTTGYRYFSSHGGAMLSNRWISPGEGPYVGGTYYLGTDGIRYENGFFVVDGMNCYFYGDGRYVAPPTINSVSYTVAGNTATVTLSATASSLTSIATYSWDGGKTWVAANQKSYPVNTTIPAGTLQVKDAIGNVTTYGSEITLRNNGPFIGIDVSSYQGVIDWAKVKASGVDFAIIRALTWSKTAGYYVIDPYFEYNVRNAKANGIKVGAYLYSYAFSIGEIVEEVNFFHNSAQMQSLRASGIKFDYPVYIDYEWDKILANTDYNTRTQIVRTGMIRLEQLGYHPGFYTYHNWAVNQFDARTLFNEGYDFWYARYLPNPDIYAGTKPLLGYSAQMWQYTSTARVDGIEGNVDMNICYVDYSKLINGGNTGGETVKPTLSVYDLNSKQMVTGQIADILAQIVQNEVAGFNNAEVYKAQAIAAYSWILYEQEHGNAIPAVGLKEASANVKNAVNQVAGKRVIYNGTTAYTPYGAASAAYTNNASTMWGMALPYLINVESPETNYRNQTRQIAIAQMTANVTKIVSSAVANATPHDQWLTGAVYNQYGYLQSIKVCGTQITGSKFYDAFYPILSPNCIIIYNQASDTWTSTTNGFGHCIGMSQHGANVYATRGYNYAQILAHYYPGTTLA